MAAESSRAFLLQSDSADRIRALRDELGRAGVRYETALVQGRTPSVAFLVEAGQLELARAVAAPLVDGPVESELREPDDHEPDHLEPAPHEFEDAEEDDPDDPGLDGPAPRFPAAALQWAAGLALLHMAIVFWALSPWSAGYDLVRGAGLSHGSWREEPWRFLSYLFVHGDPGHAFWNALPMIVFAVPLIEAVGISRTSWIYTTAGIVGGWVGLSFLDPGGILIGSSGAVAGLFGGWITLTLRRDRLRGDGWRGPIRTWGVALLFLPSLLQPVSTDGSPISVAAHMGGWLAGMGVGALLGRWVWSRSDVAGGEDRFSSPKAPEFRGDR